MKIKSCYRLRDVAGEHIVMALGEASKQFNGLIMLNDTSAFLWQQIENKDCSKEQLIHALLEEYEVDEETAKKGVEKFIVLLTQNHFVES